MDPNETLRQIRLALVEFNAFDEMTDAHTQIEVLDWLAAKVEALDEWMSKGGFLPAPWQKGRP